MLKTPVENVEKKKTQLYIHMYTVPDGQFDSQLCHGSNLTSDLRGWGINIGRIILSKHSHLFDTSQHMDSLLQKEAEHWSRRE